MTADLKSIFVSLLLLLVGALVTFVIQRYWFHKNNEVRIAETLAAEATEKARILDVDNSRMKDRLGELEMKMALVNQAMVPISTAFQAILIKELTHYHTPEMDELMQHVGPPNSLSEADETRLATLLRERTVDMGPLISDSERDAAFILPAVMKRARIEMDTLVGAEDLKLKLITVASVVGIPVHIQDGVHATTDSKP